MIKKKVKKKKPKLYKAGYGDFYKIKLNYNKLCNSIFDDMTPSLTDKVLDMQEELFSNREVDNIIDLVNIEKDIIPYLDYIIKDIKDNGNSFCNMYLSSIALGIKEFYIGFVNEELNSRCSSILENVRDSIISRLLSSNELLEMSRCDRNYVLTSMKRLNLLASKFSESLYYLNDIFMEDNEIVILDKINTKVSDDLVGCLKYLDSKGIDLGNSKFIIEKDIVAMLGIDDFFIYAKEEYYEGKEKQKEALPKKENTLEFSDGNIEYSYIDDYKKLSKLAEDNGFVYVRSNGDHGIFKHDNGCITVIPQGRSIGKGLSIKIQKSIYNLSREAS